MKTFSVIIPHKGQEQYLLRAVNSCKNQLSGEDEIIVVSADRINNGVLKQLMASHVRVTEQPGSGISEARNVGIRSINWPEKDPERRWIKFLDADDIAAPYVFSTFRNMQVPNETVVVGGMQWTVTDGSVTHSSLPMWNMMDVMNPCLLSNTFVRGVAAAEMTFDEGIGFEEDWDFWFRLREKHGQKNFGITKFAFCYYWINQEERAAKVRDHSVEYKGERIDVREYFRRRYAADPQ